MIRGVGNQSNIYQNSNNANTKKAAATANEEKMDRLEQLKASIENGEYKVDLDKLAKKMAQDLS